MSTNLATMDWQRGAQAPPELGEEHAETQRNWQRERGHSVYGLYGHGGSAAPATTTGTSTGAGGAAPQGSGGRRASCEDDRRARTLCGTQGK